MPKALKIEMKMEKWIDTVKKIRLATSSAQVDLIIRNSINKAKN